MIIFIGLKSKASKPELGYIYIYICIYVYMRVYMHVYMRVYILLLYFHRLVP